MRILDKNTDFYDYLQNVYPDPSITFDRTDSFVLTKEMLCEYLADYSYYWRRKNPYRFLLLQVCHTFWLFLVEITQLDQYDKAKAYKVELLQTWKNYQKPRTLISLDVIAFAYDVDYTMQDYSNRHWEYDREKIEKRLPALVQAVDHNNFRVNKTINKHTIYYGDAKTKAEKHIPLLKACGLGTCIDPQEIYLAFEEFFSLEKTAGERTESIGLTDNERITNHGFDLKSSFRGKQP